MILFTRGGPQWLELMADTGGDPLDLYWTCGIGKARVPVSVTGWHCSQYGTFVAVRRAGAHPY